jgi:hypothetical protein
MRRDAAFERARKVAARTMSTDEWKDDLRKEDPTKARHFRQLARLTGFGMDSGELAIRPGVHVRVALGGR